MNLAVLEEDLAAKKIAIAALLTQQSTLADSENRERTEDERKDVEKLLAEARTLRSRVDRGRADANLTEEIEKLTAGAQPQTTAAPARATKTIGRQFIESEAFAWLKKTRGSRMGAWSTPSVELIAATLTSDPASGGALVVPDYRPGIVAIAFRPLMVAELIAPGTTDSNLVSYMKELTAVNAAAAVAEGAAKPESTITFTAVQDAVRKIATWLPVSDEMLEDSAQLMSFIDGRLRLFVQLAEDDQLLNGDGVAPNLLGVRLRPGLHAALPRGTDTNEDAILKQITAIATSAYIQPDGITINPTNWLTIQLRKTTQGDYIGAGPFTAPQVPRLWGLPVANTTAAPAGIATVGAFAQASQFFRRGGLRVEASNSHADFFTKNLTAIRAEERGALAVYRPGAFGDVTGLN